ncbi:glycoside hydrolase family 27 protein [Frateuria aurantia]
MRPTLILRLSAWLAAALATASLPATELPAPTPPMGWNSWNHFAEHISDAEVRAMADAMVSSGMRDAGYTYINIDDGWQGGRDAKGNIHPNARFPDMRALADYVHARGLKLGIYSSPGLHTCAGFTGSLGHEAQDAATYAAWGVDYLKYDLCSYIQDVMQQQAPHDMDRQMALMRDAYRRMRQALNRQSHPIVYALCQYGWGAPWEWARRDDIAGQLWRTTGDIEASWDRIYAIAEAQDGLAAYAGPGHWNDPDMLEVGNGELTEAENRAHFSWWAMLAAPLLAGNDLRQMPESVRNILTRAAVIAIDQDPLGRPATRAYSEGQVEVWTRPLANGDLAMAIFNVGSARYTSMPWILPLARLGLHGPQQAINLWSGQPETLRDGQPLQIARHDVLMLRIHQPH